MKTKQYFYLDGADKKGPFSESEILELKLSNETLIFADDLKRWVPFEELDDFKNNINKIHHKIDETKKRKSLWSSNTLILYLLMLIASGIAFYLTEEYKKEDLKKLSEKANSVFNGKDEICDYIKSDVNGELKNLKAEPTFLFGYPSNNENNGNNDIYDYYHCQTGGWKIYTLKKLNNGYNLTIITSTNMGFKVPKSYIKSNGISWNGIVQEISVPTYRGSVQHAYDEAMKYLSVNSENKSYIPGSYDRIITFDELFSDLHYIENIKPTRYTSALVHDKSWEMSDSGFVYNKACIVYYKQSGKHYEIVLNRSKYYILLLINIGFGIAIAVLIYLFYKKRLKINNQ